MIVNYTGKKIIINTDEAHGVDYSNIKNFTPKPTSIILADGESAQVKLTPNTNIYILSEDCKYLGHFPMKMFRNLPEDPILYVGLKRGKEIWLSNTNALPSDADLGIAKLVDQSRIWILFLNPVYYCGFIFIIFILFIIIFTILIDKDFVTFWN